MIVKNRECLWRKEVDGVVNNPFLRGAYCSFSLNSDGNKPVWRLKNFTK